MTRFRQSNPKLPARLTFKPASTSTIFTITEGLAVLALNRSRYLARPRGSSGTTIPSWRSCHPRELLSRVAQPWLNSVHPVIGQGSRHRHFTCGNSWHSRLQPDWPFCGAGQINGKLCAIEAPPVAACGSELSGPAHFVTPLPPHASVQYVIATQRGTTPAV